jgi:F0F1-type ATP synthase assembly protein I
MHCAVQLDPESIAPAHAVDLGRPMTDWTGARSLGSRQMGDRVADKDESPDRGAFAMFGALTGIATLSAVLVVGGAGLGLLLDEWTSAPHIFVFVGIVLGILATVVTTRGIVTRFFR